MKIFIYIVTLTGAVLTILGALGIGHDHTGVMLMGASGMVLGTSVLLRR